MVGAAARLQRMLEDHAERVSEGDAVFETLEEWEHDEEDPDDDGKPA